VDGRGTEPVVSLSGVSKSFGAVRALDGVDLQIMPGEVRCLAGENGAGKSTLIKILTGAIRRDSGEYRIGGREVGNPTPAEARASGVGVVYQELSLLPDLSVEENLLMGRLPAAAGGLWVRAAGLRGAARRMLDRVGLGALDPATPVSELPAATRQMVEVAKVLGEDARLVIFDEPTTSLSDEEAGRLLRLVLRLKEEGVSVLYVTHRLEEMFEVGDTITILRDGRLVATVPAAELDHDSLIRAMVGRPVENLYPEHRRNGAGRVLLSVRGLRRQGSEHEIDLEVREGEILGLGGLVGAGRTEILRAIFGADPIEAGEIEVDGKPLRPGSPRRAVEAGLGLLSEDRKELGLLPDLSIRENVSIADLAEVSRAGVVSSGKERSVLDRLLTGLRLRYDSYEQPVSSLSGGNQQKVLLARWLATRARVLLFDEPTKGVDVGAKADIYRLIGDLSARGLGVVVVSSYLPELLGICDRVVVVREGAVAGELDAEGATEEDVLRLASGAAV
jgi:ribose transport system ATP-binding protein/rhamnose transport system ATP-binding protein